ncbi:hypothetical protein [Geomonas sp.]|uniref:hypothetical protein n=1 Tax=Geomonas sp. TaxID=2651584 RepID=UPI002B474BE2|nr:hypothetical protein [Geomonas sp.]HJV33441.1 hypothetical protein [Geomonas sp.]
MNLPKYYYYVKPLIPRRLQVALRSILATRKLEACRDSWPVDSRTGDAPLGWPGWPDQRGFAFVLTHDVDTFRGHERCRQLAQLEEGLGFRSSFNFVAAQYPVSRELLEELRSGGFEVGVHGLVHDHSLYESLPAFLAQAQRINGYLRDWQSVGFRSPCMYHNLEWLQHLDIEYDASTFDHDPFEPQSDGMGTIFPFWVEGSGGRRGYVELPYTLPQDFTVFVLLKERGIDLWKKKIDWIAERGGMALINTHPDYMCFNGATPGFQEYHAQLYAELLDYVKTRYQGAYWQPLPREMARFWEGNFKGSAPVAA